MRKRKVSCLFRGIEIIAIRRQRTVFAVGLLRVTDSSAVIDEPMMRFRPIGFRNGLMQSVLHLRGRLSLGEPQAVADAEHMGIHGDGVAAERDGIHHVRGLAAHPREAHEIFDIVGDVSAEASENISARGKDMFRLGLVKSAGKDIVL